MNIVEIVLSYKLEIIIALLSFVLLYLIYYIFERDAKYQKNLRSIASVVEELNRDIFYLRNKLTEATKKIEHQKRGLSDEEIYSEIERTVYDMIQPLALTLKEVQSSITAIDNQLESRIANLENGVKQISIPSSLSANDDERIISMYKEGRSIEAIAKDLHLTQSEVEFVLKINRVK